MAVDASLNRLREAARAARSGLAEGEPDVGAIGGAAEEIGKAIRALLRSCRVLDLESPYRNASIEAALEEAESISQMARGGTDAVATAIALESDIAELVLASGRSEVAKLLDQSMKDRKLSLRAVAKSAQLAPGYVSELENGKSGLPSQTVCQKLDGVLGTELEMTVRGYRERISRLKALGRQRRAKRPRSLRRMPPYGYRGDARTEAIVGFVVNDDDFLGLVEKLVHLPAGARRGVHKLVDELAELLPVEERP